MLGKLPVPGRPTNLDYSRARAYCACIRCGWGLFGHFFYLIYHFSSLSPSLWETARYRLKYCLKGPLIPKQPTNQPKRGRKRRERIDESKNVQTTPTRTYCKCSRPLSYCNPICRTPGTSSLPSTIAPPDHPPPPTRSRRKQKPIRFFIIKFQ